MTETPSRVRFDVSSVDADVRVAEIETTTRHQEVRAAMAVVDALCDHGVSVRDIVVVARDLDAYEDPLTRAGVRRGITPVFWTQIDLVSTRPFQLVAALCEVFATPEPDRKSLLRPLELGWVPPDPGNEWPLSPETLAEASHELPDTSETVDAWRSLLQEATSSYPRIREFVEWVATVPKPTPDAVVDVLGSAVESYREAVLPQQLARDSPALVETKTAARAVVRVERLLAQVERKYAQRLSDGLIDESWTNIAGICESLATQRPGRREHANARALDVLEANDIWARQIPFVVAVGLVEEEWSRRPRSVVPTEMQHAILSGADAAKCLSPRTAWIGGREYDQFADIVQAATAGLVVTRHAQTVDGVHRARSSLLDDLNSERVGQAARQRLVSHDGTLPRVIRSMLADHEATESEVSSDE